ncbi:TSL-kinase interacting protein 1 isoform X2 [Phragmites australis]|uniref:TSL-kinase interacting protein 1 isoform X2 n=1 Tax=Phragmites australis TaxID=29695 RepID=UPI002D793371|nr:TSL-kinase interacting protein 1 isoform X2 [Phragmites australis]
MEKEAREELNPLLQTIEIPPTSDPNQKPDSTPPSDPNQKPVKKPTRQWAAWTREEEENFFNALRQVGKNFEKITHRVQSKNKDQVRHYYYRLVRRMKKLLGPGFSLDAKNSKDTIAAMLRWWSLLEKFSCSASKLHLKPRRFKTFVEALGNQLLKDRNKSRRKCLRVDMCLSSPSSVVSKTPGNEPFPVKFLSVDTQNGSKVASPKGAFFKRIAETNSNKSGATKGDLSATRTVKQKRRAGGVVASSAYKKWERAAMAGVSLVADAAEELERNTINPSLLCNVDARTLTSSAKNLSTADGISTNHMKEVDPQAPAKLKLQLFPINEATRKALEKDEHNPYLELTLSSRKKISSVLEHLNRKWGNSNITSGELILFPYCAHQEELATYQRWTTRDTVAVADVFLSVNSPSLFRLRYGWFSLVELEAGVSEISLTHFENCMMPEDIQVKSPSGNKACVQKDGTLLSNCIHGKYPCSSKYQSTLLHITPSSTGKNAEVPEQPTNASPSQFGRQKQVQDDHGMNRAAISEGEWADTLTDMSVGYLLTEASKGANLDCIGTSSVKNALFLENPCSYDSFDAAVAFHASRYQASEQPAHTSHSTIWGAEDTCDEFSFNLSGARKQEGSNTPSSSSPDSDNEVHPSNSEGFQGFLQDLAAAEAADNPYNDDAKDEEELCAESPPRNDGTNELKDQSLADIYWPDSLGPLDLEIPSVRYQADDLLLGDSQNSWNRMMANSLDAFRNLSFFSMDKNDSIPSIM